MKVPDPQQLPGTPAQVQPSGFNLTYFFQQWQNIAQVVNNHYNVLLALIDNIQPKTFTGVITTAKLTGGGTNGSMTFVNGVLTEQTPAT